MIANIGIKDETEDFVVIYSDYQCPASAVFTRSRFAGPSVLISREHITDGRLKAVVTISKNGNVANGERGYRDAEELVSLVAGITDGSPTDVLVGSTGIIGVPYPMDRIRSMVPQFRPLSEPDFFAAARGIMTTDTHPKVARVGVGEATIVGIAKGIGMIEPNMATLLAYFFTDAEVDAHRLDEIFRRVVDRTFNSVSIDTDTSTSDTAAALANGEAGPVDLGDFESALYSVAESLVKMIACDGETATKLIEVDVGGARDEAQARRVAKSIVNSPLVKTAVHGSDPNWGRVAMAIGKCSDEYDIDPDKVEIRFGDLRVYPESNPNLKALVTTMSAQHVPIRVRLNIGDGSWRVWGCDLTAKYLELNSNYSS